MAKIKIFVSYSFQDTAICLALKGALTSSATEVHVNTGVNHTQQLHREISTNLNKCDVVIPIITTNWITSHECRDELVRANERRKPIIPFRHQSVTNDGPPKLPWYLTETLYVSWHENELERAISELRDALSAIQMDSWQSACYRDLRQIGDDVQKSEAVSTWKSSLCQRVLSLAKSQMNKVLVNDECSFPVAQEQAYLRFAEPIFGEAKSIIAVCIASISTFWTSPDFRSAAGEYLNSQRASASSIVRLFVFESASELALFRQIIQKHYDAYGFRKDVSGVFLCSTDSYAKLLSRWSMTSDGRAMNQDFGILSFQDAGTRMHATLDCREFRYDVYEEGEGSITGYKLIEEYFEDLKSLQLGERHPESGAIRWSPEWGHDDNKFAKAVEVLFQDKDWPTTHVVLIRPMQDSIEISEFLRNLVVRFYNQRKALKIGSITLKRRSDLPRTDGRYNAPLLVLQNFEYFLLMTFDDENSLRDYYMHEVHSLEREKLYKLLNPEVEPIFADASRLPKGQVQERASLFSRIENAMIQGGFLQRIDVRDDDPLALLLSRSCVSRS